MLAALSIRGGWNCIFSNFKYFIWQFPLHDKNISGRASRWVTHTEHVARRLGPTPIWLLEHLHLLYREHSTAASPTLHNLICSVGEWYLEGIFATSSQLPPSHTHHLCKASLLTRITDLRESHLPQTTSTPIRPTAQSSFSCSSSKMSLNSSFLFEFLGMLSIQRPFFEILYFHLQPSFCLLCPNRSAHLSNEDLQMEKESSWLLLKEMKKQLSQHKNIWLK